MDLELLISGAVFLIVLQVEARVLLENCRSKLLLEPDVLSINLSVFYDFNNKSEIPTQN